MLRRWLALMIWSTGRKLIRVWFWLLGRVILGEKLGKLVRSFGIFMRRLLRSDGDGEYCFFLFSFVVFWWCIIIVYAWCIKSKLYYFPNLFILKISTKDNNNLQIPNHSQFHRSALSNHSHFPTDHFCKVNKRIYLKIKHNKILYPNKTSNTLQIFDN